MEQKYTYTQEELETQRPEDDETYHRIFGIK